MPAVHQGAGPDDRRDPRRQRPEPRRAAVDRRPARRRGGLGVRRPLARTTAAPPTPRRRCPPTSTRRSPSPRRRAEEFPLGDDWTALAAVGAHGDLVGTAVDEAARRRTEPPATSTLAQADLLRRPADGRRRGAVRARRHGHRHVERAARAGRRRERHHRRCRRRLPAHGDGWAFTAFVGDVYRDGANDVALYEVADRRRHAPPPRLSAVALGELVDRVDLGSGCRGRRTPSGRSATAAIGSVSHCSTAAPIADVTSLAVGSTKAAPMATRATPTVDALVRACMRVEGVGEAHDADGAEQHEHGAAERDGLADHSPRPSMKRAITDVLTNDTRASTTAAGRKAPRAGVHGVDDDQAHAGRR